ncbi:hypothetical protein DPMN_125844, partial [Dreissena polymorpha]
ASTTYTRKEFVNGHQMKHNSYTDVEQEKGLSDHVGNVANPVQCTGPGMMSRVTAISPGAGRRCKTTTFFVNMCMMMIVKCKCIRHIKNRSELTGIPPAE